MAEVVTATKAAKMLGVSPATMLKQIKEGNLPGSYKFGGKYLVPLETIQAVKSGTIDKLAAALVAKKGEVA